MKQITLFFFILLPFLGITQQDSSVFYTGRGNLKLSNYHIMSKHWQSFGEFNGSDAYQKTVNDEFKEDLPFEETGKLLDSKTPRRDFLKYVGFTTTAAAVAASCETPLKKSIPFVNRPEDITPGVPNFYATTYTQDGEALSVIAKVRDGRPIKIEGNELNPLTQGGTSAKAQASLTVRPTGRTGGKPGFSDPVVAHGCAIAQRIKGTPGITG